MSKESKSIYPVTDAFIEKISAELIALPLNLSQYDIAKRFVDALIKHTKAQELIIRELEDKIKKEV